MSSTVDTLVQQLRAASKAYYNGGPLLMDDDTFDAAVERLRELDPDHPFLEEVGAPPASGTVRLPFAMPSLDKIKPGEDRLARWLAATPPSGLLLSEKLDGLSALWLPKERKLYLRGDGLMGQDVSHIVGLGVQGLRLTPAEGVAVRGELTLPRSTAREVGTDQPRAWVNGLLHRKDPAAADVVKIRFVAYELLAPGGMSREDQFTWLRTAGYEIPWTQRAERSFAAALEGVLKERRAASRYDTDGIVVGYNTVPKSESTATKARNPKDCVAFKMPLAEQSAETTVREVIWGASAQGYLIPKLQFDPVSISSATIQFCTAHNAKTVEELMLGPGARIVVRRSGDVIPKLDRVLVAAASASFPPAGTYEWDGTRTHIRATGATLSKDVIIARLGHFLKTLEIPGAGPATATGLVEAGITGPAALWAAKPERLSEVLGPKTGAALWGNLRTALEKATEMDLMIASSEMPRGIGQTKLTVLFQRDVDPRRWRIGTGCDAPTGWTQQTLGMLWTAMPTYEAWRAKELSWIPYPKMGAAPAAAAVQAQPARGTLCMTGFRDKALEEKATAAGWTVAATFTGKVTLLLVPDGPIKESEKTKAARARGCAIQERSAFAATL